VIPPGIPPVERAKDDSDRRRVDQVFEEHYFLYCCPRDPYLAGVKGAKRG
jgi:hypothetical protein